MNAVRTIALGAGLAAWVFATAGCIIVAGNGRGYSSNGSSWSEDTVSEVRTLTVAHVADAPLDVRTQNGSVELEQGGTNEVIKDIGSVHTVIDQISEHEHSIAAAVEEQSAVIAEISRNAQASSAGAEETRSSADELSRLALQLEELVKAFDVEPV
jgi:methyl-accepting chemotaxis protein